jgi:hypothetical protein
VIEEAMDAIKEAPAEVSRVAVRLSPFYAEEPEVWFASVEAQLPWLTSPRKIPNSTTSAYSWTTIKSRKCETSLLVHLNRTHTRN